MESRSKKTLQRYGLTVETFTELWNSQAGRCAICGVSEDELVTKHQDWRADQVLHIDHEQGTFPYRVRGLLCKDCNYDLEAYIRKAPVRHPAGRGRSMPRNDPRFKDYLERTAVSRTEKRKYQQPIAAAVRQAKERALLEEWSHRHVVVSFKNGSERFGTLLDLPEECAFQLFGANSDDDDHYDDSSHTTNQVHFVKDVTCIREAGARLTHRG